LTNGVLALDGNNSTATLPPNVFDDLSAATVEGWVKFGDTGVMRWFSYGPPNGEMGVGIANEGRFLTCFLHDERGSIFEIRTEEGAEVGAWTHMAFVSGPGGMRLYADGVLIGTNAYTGSFSRLPGGAPNALGLAHFMRTFIGRSPAMQGLIAQIRTLQPADTTTVLIRGESGTGKELVARALHFSGRRVRKPFIAVNCAAIPAELAESLFFGHVKGAVSGAHENRKGYFEMADGGTLFLDEIGDMPLLLQAKLLRTLEDGSFRPVGATAAVPCRVEAARLKLGGASATLQRASLAFIPRP
jgi:hypothetical protein